MIASSLRSAMAMALLLQPGLMLAAQIDLPGPTGSGAFGTGVTLLPNGNFVVTDPDFDAPAGAANVGAVYLYKPNGELIYRLVGSSTNDQIASYGITVLTNGNFVVNSPSWDNVAVFDAGAVTWCSGSTGSNQVVSAGNSLVGTSASNNVGSGGVYALSNGNYVVSSYEWDSSTAIDVGAVTWGNGATGSAGPVGADNSLIGSSTNDLVGVTGITALSNGNYVVNSTGWNNGSITEAGAVTWRSGAGPGAGIVSASNSYVGSAQGDRVGLTRVTPLTNGHYVVGSANWDNGSIVDAGAATWGDGTVGSSGPLSAANSLVGSSANDQVSSGTGQGLSIVALTNGHYVVRSTNWDNGSIADVGAVTWGNGMGGIVGPVNPGNSLVGSSAGDVVGGSSIGGGGVFALPNGNYVVASPLWDNGGIANAGAATWRSGTSGSSGGVSATNSLVGSSTDNFVGGLVYPLVNGNYVVVSSLWDNGAIGNAGAATWRDGSGGSGAVVSASNSLVGSTTSDQIGSAGVAALSDGSYVVASPNWSTSGAPQAGAVTWRNGMGGSGATVGSSNSIVGTGAQDELGEFGVTALSNGRYVFASPSWNNGPSNNANFGAVTWRGGGSSSGTVTASNSLVGNVAGDLLGFDQQSFPSVAAQANGNYVFRSSYWDGGGSGAGAVTIGFANGTSTGVLTAANSVRGTSAAPNASFRLPYVYDAVRAQLIVGRPDSNIVTLLRPGAVTSASIVVDTPDPSEPGQVVTFVTTIVATPAPSSGSVRIAADSGETCTDFAPTVTGTNTAEFSCQIQFASVGARNVRAEFLGTNTHGFSASALEPHNVAANIFANGFE